MKKHATNGFAAAMAAAAFAAVFAAPADVVRTVDDLAGFDTSPANVYWDVSGRTGAYLTAVDTADATIPFEAAAAASASAHVAPFEARVRTLADSAETDVPTGDLGLTLIIR